MKNQLLLYFFLFFIAEIQAQTERKQTTAMRSTSKIKLDGILDEPEWLTVPVAKDFIQTELNTGKPATFPTEVRVLYDDKAVYIGATMFDAHPDSISKELILRDQIGAAKTDWFGVLIDTYHDGNNGYAFIVTPESVQADSRHFAGGENGFTEDFTWNAVWEAQAKITDKGWTVEMAIPYSAIRFSNDKEQKWRINFARSTRRAREKSFWNFVNPVMIGIVPQSGEIDGINGIKAPLRLQATPFASMYVQNNRTKNDNGSITNSWGTNFNAGMDIKYGINDAFTLDMTLIPDFGQVQSDPRVVNLTPFEVRYDENRPFFTEGVELFNKGGYFYSRRIGAVPGFFQDDLYNNHIRTGDTVTNLPSQANLYNATKVSGRLPGGLGIGVLNAIAAPTYATVRDIKGNDRSEQVTPLTNYNVISFDKNLPNNSYFTLINTNVMRSGAAYDANVTGFTTELKNKKNIYSLLLSGAASQKHYTDNTSWGYKYQLEGGKSGGKYQWWVFNDVNSYRYDPNDLGYIQRLNSQIIGVWNAFFQSEPKGIFNKWNIIADVFVQRLNFPNITTGWGVESMGFFQPKKLTGFGTGYNFNFRPASSDDYYEPRTSDYSRYLKIAPNYLFGAFISTDYNRPLAIDVRGNFKQYADTGNHNGYDLTVAPRFRFNDKVFLIWTTSYTRNNHFINYVSGNSDAVGYAGLNADPILMGERDQITVVNAPVLKWSFNHLMGVSFRLRHYWTSIKYNHFFELGQQGNLLATNYTGFKGDKTSLHDTNFNIFNIDASYTWRFAPGSDMIVNWKNSIFNGSNDVTLGYFDNARNLLDNPMNNSLSLKVVYFLDYLKLVKKA